MFTVSSIKKPLVDAQGAAMVEFSIVALLLFTLLFGGIEWGLVLYNKQVLANASREGARGGITRNDFNADSTFNSQDIDDLVSAYCDGRLFSLPDGIWEDGDANPPVVSYPLGGVNGAFQTDLTVQVDYQHNFYFSGFAGFPNTAIQAFTTMKMEQDPDNPARP